jgi:hypothetical protein
VSEGARKSNAALPAVVVPEHGQGLSPADRLHRRADSTRQSHVSERAFPLGTVAGVIGVILLLIGLVLIFGRSRRGSTSNQPPAHTHEEKPPEEGPEPPPEKSNAPPPAEMAAITAWNKAEEFYRAQKWAEARDAYQAFQNSHGTTKEGKARADTVKARLATVLEALRPPCQLPDSWKGGNAGTTDNNPLLVDGKPRWRLDQIWPDDPLRPGSYKPMPWNGQAWQPRENTHGDQPQASLAGGRLEIANRTAWTDQPGDKLAALVFIAPSAGRYSLAGNVTPAVSDSGRPLALLILRRDPVASRVEQVASLPLQDKQRTAIKDATVMLDAGQELVILPAFTGTGLCACTFAFEGLKIEALPVK